MSDLFFDTAFLSGSWANDVRLTVDSGGWITSVAAETTPKGARHVPGIAVPGGASSMPVIECAGACSLH